ncbi:MAG: phosphoglucosamine mutase [Armatimonadota bacterium]
MRKLFGTDGVRGVANLDLTPETVFRLGRAGAYVLSRGKKKCTIVLGKDTRISGDLLEGALISGICSVGGDVFDIDVVPTPAVAYLTRKLEASAGVMISASHNPIEDNGIKFFSSDGFKLPDEVEKEIENLVFNNSDELPRPTHGDVGRLVQVRHAGKLYSNYVKEKTNADLTGLKIVLDCAHGASYKLAPRIFQDLGAETLVLNHQPNGVNINVNCGSTNMELLKKVVVASSYDMGIAFDGDADRALAVDDKGRMIDGDHIMAIFAGHLKTENKLVNNKVVTTVMSNIGLQKALEAEQIEMLRVKVGDRYVLEEMKKVKAILGGEQSGHIIMLDYNTTGDGIITAVMLADIVRKSAKPLSELAKVVTKYPQILINVKVKNNTGYETHDEIRKAIEEVESALKGKGRLLVRPSGTEPIIRVMAEGPDKDELEKLARRISKALEQNLGA